jgi:hypothetical protein
LAPVAAFSASHQVPQPQSFTKILTDLPNLPRTLAMGSACLEIVLLMLINIKLGLLKLQQAKFSALGTDEE